MSVTTQQSGAEGTPRRLPLSLGRVLLAFVLFGVACGCIRHASANNYEWLAILGVMFLGLSIGTVTRWHIVSMLTVAVIAFASYATTSVIWDGGFPPCELQITIVDEFGTPVEGVEMSVVHSRSRKPAQGYPIAEYGTVELLSNRDGQIVCHQLRRGLQFGGRAWTLFWCIPFGAKAPDFDAQFKHPDGQLNVPVRVLFWPSNRGIAQQTTTYDLDGVLLKMPVYKHRFELSPR